MINPTDRELQMMQDMSDDAEAFSGEFLTFDNCTFFDNDFWSDNDQIVNDVETIATEVRTKWISDTDKYNKNMLVILVNLYIAHVTKQGMWVAYSRDKNNYEHNQYNRQRLSHKYTTDAVDRLAKHDYIEHAKGYLDRSNPLKYRGKRSRMRPTRKLIQIIDRWDESGVARFPHAQTVIRRDKDKKPATYNEDTRSVPPMKKRLVDINTMLAEADIQLDITPAEKEQLDRERLRQKKGRINYWRKSLFRVFSNKSFTQGGRFYGGWWELVNKDIRKNILINGQPTVERDYKSLHPSMLYIKETGDLPGFDPYKVDGANTSDLLRKVSKTLLLIMINAKAGKSIKDAFFWNIQRNGKYSVQEQEIIAQTIDIDAIIEKLKKHNKTIRKYFSSNEGIKLQFTDSQIIDRVMTKLQAKGIVSLPVHDSLLVQKQHETELVEAMKEAFAKKFGGVIPEID